MVFSVLSQQQTDTQETMEDRQPVLVTSEGEVQREGRRKSFEGSMTLSSLQLNHSGEKKDIAGRGKMSQSLSLSLSCGGCLFRDLLFPTN